MKQIAIILSLILTLAFSALAKDVYTPDAVPNVNIADRREYVSDPENMLSPQTKAAVSDRLWQLRKNTSAEAMVVIIPSTGDMPIEDFSEKIFTSWGLGKSDKDNGLLLVIAVDDRKARIQTGYGIEGIIPDISARNIISRAIAPNMVEGDLDAAVDQATTLMTQALSDPAVADELKSSEADNFSGGAEALDPEVVWNFVRYVALVVFLLTAVLFVTDLVKTRRRDNFFKAQRWRSHIWLYCVASFMSLGSALIFLIIDLLLYKSYRNRRRRCDTCGARMRKLSEEEDNLLLNPSQDFEEKLDTVDYDVWECPSCGTIERFPFRKNQTKYTECPNCHTIAMCLTCDKIIVPPTVRRPGRGEKIYSCRFCGHQKHEHYVIPKKDSAAPLAAGIALGAMSGHGGSGSGFGGGFGGGATGGGGASGGW